MAELKATKDTYREWLEEERFALRLTNLGLRTWLLDELGHITAKLRTTNIVGQEGDIMSYRSVYGSVLDDLERIVDKTRHELDTHYDAIALWEKRIKEAEAEEAEEAKLAAIQEEADKAGIPIVKLGPEPEEASDETDE